MWFLLDSPSNHFYFKFSNTKFHFLSELIILFFHGLKPYYIILCLMVLYWWILKKLFEYKSMHKLKYYLFKFVVTCCSKCWEFVLIWDIIPIISAKTWTNQPKHITNFGTLELQINFYLKCIWCIWWVSFCIFYVFVDECHFLLEWHRILCQSYSFPFYRNKDWHVLKIQDGSNTYISAT